MAALLPHIMQYFQHYSADQAPFMHQQFQSWQHERPLAGLSVLHNVPLVTNTLLKIACLAASGAQVIVTNPNFALV